MSLPDALSASGSGMPAIYRAVVEAGVKSGRLAEALEGMAGVARGYAEARRTLGLALLYPMVLLCLAYGMIVAFVVVMAPRLVIALKELGLSPLGILNVLAGAGELAVYWAPILPVILFFLAIRWVISGRSIVLDTGRMGSLLNRIPLVGSMIGYFRSSQFAHLLALLIDHELPLDEAVQLAGNASGDERFQVSAREFADSIRLGGVFPQGPGVFPPLLAYILQNNRQAGGLSVSLRHAGDDYRRKAQDRGELLRRFLPGLCLVFVGAGAVLAYALMLFLPLTTLWDELANPVNL